MFIVATARINGDHMPNSRLDMTSMESFCQLREHIKLNFKFFLEQPGYSEVINELNSIMVYKNNDKEPICSINQDTGIENDTPFSLIDQFKEQINLLIDFMEECYHTYNSSRDSNIMRNRRKVVYFDQESEDYVEIIAYAHAKRFHIHFNQAPNMNKWEQLDVTIHY